MVGVEGRHPDPEQWFALEQKPFPAGFLALRLGAKVLRAVQWSDTG